MKQKEFDAWTKVREKGRMRYVLTTGLSWGAMMFVVMTFFVHKIKTDNPVAIALSAVIWALGGLFFGFAMWFTLERRYKKAARSR